MFTIKVFVTNLGLYNEGDLVGGWLTLPAENDDIHIFMDDVVKISACGDEYFLTDWEDDGVEGLCKALGVGEYSNVFELSERLEELNNQIGEADAEADAEALEASLEVFNLEDAVRIISNRDYSIYYDCYTPRDVAEVMVFETGMLDKIPENIAMYFDYEAYGRDLAITETLVFHGDDCYWFYN